MLSKPRKSATFGFCLSFATTALAQFGPPQVAVTPVVERDVPVSIRLVGTVLPARNSIVAAEVPGLIAVFSAEEGQFLHAGDVICQLEQSVPRLRLTEAQATLAALETQLLEWENGERPEVIARLSAAVDEAEAMRDKWQREYEWNQRLYEGGQATSKELFDVEKESIAAVRRLAQAEATLAEAKNGTRPEVIAKARHDVAAQRAVVERLEHDLAKTETRAPFDGFLVAKRTEIGEWIDEGGPVCDMVALDSVKVRADVPENAVRFAHPGESATIDVEALGRTLTAPITRLIPQAKAAARTFPIEIDVPNPDHALLAGMFVWVHAPAGPPGRRPMVPKDAIVADGPNKRVYVIRPGANDQKMALPVSVATGLEVSGAIEIAGSGIQVGDLVVVRANERLYGPTPVIPVPLGSPETQPQAAAPQSGDGAAARPPGGAH